jgi:hypothetical protein
MPEFDYFITADEYAAVLVAAFGAGFRLCLKKQSLKAKLEYVAESREIHELIKAKQHAFLLERDDFTRCPVELRTTVRNRDGRRVWYPSVMDGGPVIETYFWHPYTKEGVSVVPCSLIAYGRKFFNPGTGHEELAGEPTKEAYDSIVVPLRKSFRRVQSAKGIQVAYVSPSVDAMLDAGWRLAGYRSR